MTQEHARTIVKQTPGGGTHTYFIYEELPKDKEILKTIKTVTQNNISIMRRTRTIYKEAKKNNDALISLVPSLEELIRGGTSSNMYVRNGWSGL